MLTVDEEHHLIWHRSWDLTKVVYLLNRYGIEVCLIYVCYSESCWRVHRPMLTLPNKCSVASGPQLTKQ